MLSLLSSFFKKRNKDYPPITPNFQLSKRESNSLIAHQELVLVDKKYKVNFLVQTNREISLGETIQEKDLTFHCLSNLQENPVRQAELRLCLNLYPEMKD